MSGDPFIAFIGRNGDPCPCPSMPVNWWYRPSDSTWAMGAQLPGPPDGTAVVGRVAGEDADRFLAGGFRAWAILCPDCGTVYAAGSVTH